MITTIAWILLVIVLIIFAFALFLFLWHPAKKEPEVIPDTSIPVYRHARKEAGEDYSWKTERYLEEAQLRWPQLPLMLERIQLDHTLLMHWNGLSKSRHDLLFSFTDRSSAEALFEAVEQISEADEIPEADFWIMIPLSDEEAVSETEVYEYFNTNHIQLDAMIACGEGFINMPGMGGYEACIGIGTKAYCKYQITGDNEEYDWMASLQSSSLFLPSWNHSAEMAAEAIYDKLPSLVHLELKLKRIYGNKAMQDIMRLYPSTESWFYPVLEKDDTTLYVYADTTEILHQADTVLEKYAKDSHIQMDILKIHEAEKSVSSEDREYLYLKNAVKESFQIQAVIPVLSMSEDDSVHPFKTLYFMPSYDHMQISSSGSVAFYRNLLNGSSHASGDSRKQA